MNRYQRDVYCGTSKTFYHRIAPIVGSVILLLCVLYILLQWKTLPDEIPTNFDFQGNPTGWDSKNTVWTMPIIGFVIELALSLAGLFPKGMNTGIRVTEQNKPFVYRAMFNLMADMQISMAVAFTAFTVVLVSAPEHLNAWMPAAFFVLLLWPIIPMTIRLIRIKRAFG